MAEYIELDSDPRIPPPYQFPGVTLRSFRLPADIIRLQGLCDRYLNIGSLLSRGFEYIAITPFVDLEILNYPTMLNTLPPYAGRGSAKQHELYFKIFVAKFQLIDGWLLLPAPMISTFYPYIFVNNNWSLIAGREVIGFPKLYADIQFAAGGNNPYPISASTLAVDVYNPNSVLTMREVVAVTGSSSVNVPPARDTWLLSPAEIASFDSTLQAALSAGVAADEVTLRTAHLQQLRSPGDPANASYQAIVEGECTAGNIILIDAPAAEITLSSYASLSIAATLGLPTGAPLQPLSQFAATCDLAFNGAATVFENE